MDNQDYIQLIAVILIAQTILNGILIGLWTFVQNVFRRSEEKSDQSIIRIDRVLAEQATQIRLNGEFILATNKQLADVLRLFLKPDPKLYEFVARELAKAAETHTREKSGIETVDQILTNTSL